MRQRCVCNCGVVFLDMDAYEYVKYHHLADPNITETDYVRKFDKWFVLAMVHWIENPTHTIIVSCGFQEMDITEQHRSAFKTFGPEYLQNQKSLMEQAWEETYPI